jgi:tetratricopeptide (TPR) repeat protein/tRNA A-37 threonylcarbamoyl transferase component Bud32
LRGFHVAGEEVDDHTWVEVESAREALTLTLPESPDGLADTAVETPVLEQPPEPDRIGRFVLKRFLGEGVFGRVYHAHDPQLDREVALKVAKPEHLSSPERRQRFFREARAAANLRHPHIVPLFEMGQDGPHAYLASAFIEGRTLEAALRDAPGGRLDPRLAAWIVLHLAEALAYAHSMHIVHRDVKPANILLEGQGLNPSRPPVPLLMDFGLAARVAGDARLTHDGTILGTPLYMAPESCSGSSGAALPASDQYSLGVVLYELLTGQTPFSGPVQAVLLLHQTQDPPQPRKVRRDLPLDLETIVLKTLEKDPRRRYASCQELADDLRRWLDGDPIHARRLGVAERAWRAARSNPALAIVSVVFVAFLIAGLLLVSSLYLQADRDRIRAQASEALAADRLRQTLEQSQRARMEADKSLAVTRFLIGTFEASDPLGLSTLPARIPRETGEKLTALEVLDRGAARLEADTSTPPSIRAAIHDTIGGVYRSLGRYPEAEKHLRAARELRQADDECDPLDRAATLHNLGWLLHEQGYYPEAEKLYREALKIRQETEGADPALVHATLFNLAWLLGEMHCHKESIRLFSQVLNARLTLNGPHSREVACTRLGLAAVYLDADRMVDAEPYIIQALGYFQKQEGGQSLGKAVGLFQQGMVARNVLKDFTLAEKSFRQSMRLAEDALGTGSIYVQLVRFELAGLYAENKKLDEAENLYRDCLEAGRKRVGLAHPRFHTAVKEFGDLLVRRGKTDEAVALFEEALRETRKRFGPEHYLTGKLAFLYAMTLEGTPDLDDRYEKIESLFALASRSLRTAPAELRYQAAWGDNRLGIARSRRHADAEAEASFRAGIAWLNGLDAEQRRQDPDLLAFLLVNLASSRMDQNVYDAEVGDLLREGLAEARVTALNQQAHRWALTTQSTYLRHLKRFTELKACLTEYREASDTTPEALYDLADESVQASVACPDRHLREHFADQAVEALTRAVRSGLQDLQRLRTETVWAPLRGRADFQKLMPP